MYLRVSPPPSLVDENKAQIDDVIGVNRTRAVKLTKDELAGMEKFVKSCYSAWDAGTQRLHSKLNDLNDFLDGKREQVDFPIGENSSNIDIRYALGQARTLRASMVRAVFNDPRVFIAQLGPGAARKDVNELETAVNWTASETCNLIERLKQTPIPTFRDGISLIFGEWARQVENGTDYKFYDSVDSFREDYTSAAEAGLSEEEYTDALNELSQPQGEVETEFDIDFVSKNNAEFTLFPLAKLIWYPLYCEKFEDMDIYGFSYVEGRYAFEMNADNGYYIKDAAKAVKKVEGKGTGDVIHSFDKKRDLLDGIDSEDREHASYKLAKLVVKYDLNDDGIPETYFVILELDKKKILRVEKYTIRRNVPCIHGFRFVKKDGRFLGDSLLEDCEDLARELNAMHRHRSNVRKITDAPVLMMPDSLKDDVDLGADWATFQPGTTIWIPDVKYTPDKLPRQLALRNVDNSNLSIQEEMAIQRYCEILLGTTQAQTGKEASADPRAPARKTAMLLQRSDLRTEDFIEEWKQSVPGIVEFLRALYYQNARGGLKYMKKVKGEDVEMTLAPAMLVQPQCRFKLKAANLSMSPEAEVQKYVTLFALAAQLQLPIQKRPLMAIEVWNRVVAATRVEAPEKFYIDMDEMEPQEALQTMQGRMEQAGAPQQPGQPRNGINPKLQEFARQIMAGQQQGGGNDSQQG